MEANLSNVNHTITPWALEFLRIIHLCAVLLTADGYHTDIKRTAEIDFFLLPL